jgi:hypothetical protein
MGFVWFGKGLGRMEGYFGKIFRKNYGRDVESELISFWADWDLPSFVWNCSFMKGKEVSLIYSHLIHDRRFNFQSLPSNTIENHSTHFEEKQGTRRKTVGLGGKHSWWWMEIIELVKKKGCKKPDAVFAELRGLRSWEIMYLIYFGWFQWFLL